LGRGFDGFKHKIEKIAMIFVEEQIDGVLFLVFKD